MNLPRRRFLHLAVGAAALPAVSHSAWAQAYPTRPVRIIVGFAEERVAWQNAIPYLLGRLCASSGDPHPP